MTIRAVIDTNVLISYLISHHGVIGEIIDHHWCRGDFTLLTFPELITEITEVVERSRLASLIDADAAGALLAALHLLGEMQALLAEIPVFTRDPDDDVFVAYALAGNADFIVSGDNDLLALKRVNGVRIVSPAEFLAVLSSASSVSP